MQKESDEEQPESPPVCHGLALFVLVEYGGMCLKNAAAVVHCIDKGKAPGGARTMTSIIVGVYTTSVYGPGCLESFRHVGEG
jgi:hypothetical protein